LFSPITLASVPIRSTTTPDDPCMNAATRADFCAA